MNIVLSETKMFYQKKRKPDSILVLKSAKEQGTIM